MSNEKHIYREYEPHDRQRLAHAAPQRWTLYGGAWRGGKSRWLIEENIELALEYPGIELAIGRYDRTDVMEPTQVYDLFHRVCPPELIKAEYLSAPTWTQFVNGSRITWVGLKDYKPGGAYGGVSVDQAEEVPEETLRQLNSRLQQELPGGGFPRYRMLLNCNPHPRMEWYFAAMVEHPEEFAFVMALPSDNPYNPPGYIESQRVALTEVDFKRFMEGSWDAFEGQAITEFDRNVHVVEPFGTWKTEEWPVWRGIDYGLNHPTVCEWLTVSPDGDMFFCQEYERAGTVPSVSGKEIIAMSDGLNQVHTWWDPRLEMVKADLLNSPTWSVADEWKRQGILDGTTATASREDRLSAWKQALKIDPTRRHYLTHQLGAPRLYIMRTCQRLTWELPRLQYREALTTYDDIVKSDDDAYDAGGFILTNLLNKDVGGRQRRVETGIRLGR